MNSAQTLHLNQHFLLENYKFYRLAHPSVHHIKLVLGGPDSELFMSLAFTLTSRSKVLSFL